MGAIGPYEFQGKFVWTNGTFALFSGKFVWTNGAESSSKVSPETGIGPWMALPNMGRLFFWGGGVRNFGYCTFAPKRNYCLINSPSGHLCNSSLHFMKMNSPESQICNSVGPCSRKRKIHISEINSDQGQISKEIRNISGSQFPHKILVYLILFCVDSSSELKQSLSSGASGGCLHWGASSKVEKAHFAARKKGPENCNNEVKLPPRSVPPPEALYDIGVAIPADSCCESKFEIALEIVFEIAGAKLCGEVRVKNF